MSFPGKGHTIRCRNDNNTNTNTTTINNNNNNNKRKVIVDLTLDTDDENNDYVPILFDYRIVKKEKTGRDGLNFFNDDDAK